MSRARILLAESQTMVAEALSVALGSKHDIVGIVSDAAQVVASVAEHRPDVILLDQNLLKGMVKPILEGLKHSRSTGRVLIMTTPSDEDHVLGDLRGIAAGFISKNYGLQDLRTAIEEVMCGSRHAPHRLVDKRREE